MALSLPVKEMQTFKIYLKVVLPAIIFCSCRKKTYHINFQMYFHNLLLRFQRSLPLPAFEEL